MAVPNTYTAGDVVRLSVTFTDNSVDADPTTVTLAVKNGTAGASTTYTYPADIVKDGTGLYHYDYTTSASGTYYYRWTGTGTVVAAVENWFYATSPGNFE